MQHWRFSGNDTTSHPRMFAYMPSSLIVESLVMSKLGYGWVILYPPPPPRLSNEMAAKSSNNMHGLSTWADGFCFWGLAKIELATHYWKERPVWHCWNPFLKPFTMWLGLITYALNFILPLPISTKFGYSNWKRHFSGLGSEIVFNSLLDKLRQETHCRKFVWWAKKPCSPCKG